MILFATPDFGASFIISIFLLIIFAVILFVAGIGIFYGSKLLKSEKAGRRKNGGLLIMISIFIPLFCLLAPPHLVRLTYGNYPIGSYPSDKIHKGMTFDEVESALGPPHQRTSESDRETWIYWIDSFAINYCGVDFGPDRRVSAIYGN
jgi:hypothetical protein